MSQETKKAKKTKTPAGAKISKEFTFTLTPEEVREKLRASKKLRLEHAVLSADSEEYKEKTKAKLTSLAARRDELYRVAEDEVERRTVDAIEVFNYAEGKIEYWFEGEVLESREMTDDERQMKLDDIATKKGKAKQAKAAAEAPAKTEEQKAQENSKACVAVPGKQPPRGQRQSIGNDHEPDQDIGSVIRAETGRKTKTSAVDGPSPN